MEEKKDNIEDIIDNDAELEENTETGEMIPKAEYDELEDRYKRVHAEFDNYKKRSDKLHQTIGKSK